MVIFSFILYIIYLLEIMTPADSVPFKSQEQRPFSALYFICWLVIKKPWPKPPFRGHLSLGDTCLGPEGVP